MHYYIQEEAVRKVKDYNDTCISLHRTEWISINSNNVIISNIANYGAYSNTSIVVTFYVITNSGGILNRQALLGALIGGISNGSYSDAGFSILASITEPTSGGAEVNTSSGTNIIIGATVGVVGIIAVLILVLVIILVRV